MNEIKKVENTPIPTDLHAKLGAHGVAQVLSTTSFVCEHTSTNAMSALTRFPKQDLEARRCRIQERLAAGEVINEAIEPVEDSDSEEYDNEAEDVQEIQDKHKSKYRQHKIGKLNNLRNKVPPKATKEQILKAVTDLYPSDADLADEALDFLAETSVDPADKTITELAKKEFESTHQNEIEMGLRVANEALKSDVSPSMLRDLYRDITHNNQREPRPLFIELTTRYKGQNLKEVYKFLLHAAGAEINAEGSMIEPGMMASIVKEIRTLQSLIALTNYFKAQNPRLGKELEKVGVEPKIQEGEEETPTKIEEESSEHESGEIEDEEEEDLLDDKAPKEASPIEKALDPLILSSLFLDFATAAYPDPVQIKEKISTLIKEIAVENLDSIQNVKTEIIFGSVMRDAVRQVAPKIFQRIPHEEPKVTFTKRDLVFDAFIDTLENLEDELEELEEEAGIDEDEIEEDSEEI